MYSAVKINGKRLYELARAGAEVERKPREIEIEEITLLPSAGHTEKEAHQTVYFSALPNLRIKVVCSKGTYIRTLCQDIGEKLGCGAVMSSLVRTRVGGFLLENAYTLAEIEQIRDTQGLEKILIPVDSCFAEYPAVQVLEEGLRFLRNGNELKRSMVEYKDGNEKKADGFVRIYDKDGVFYGVYELNKEKNTLKPWKMFLPE